MQRPVFIRKQTVASQKVTMLGLSSHKDTVTLDKGDNVGQHNLLLNNGTCTMHIILAEILCIPN